MSSRNRAPHLLSRRDLMWKGAQAVGAGVFASRFGMLSALAQTTNPFSDYKALVCIFLNGGNDAFNMVAPWEATPYGYYSAARSGAGLAIAREALLQIDSQGQGVFGLHPNMTGLRNIYNQGDLAVACNVGTLLYPFVDKNDYRNNSTKRPRSLFDHSIQTDTWQNVGLDEGWGNNVGAIVQARLTAAGEPAPKVPVLVNVTGGGSVYLAGDSPYITLPPGSQTNGSLTLSGYNTSNSADVARRAALEQIFRLNHGDPVVKTINDRTDRAIKDGQTVSTILKDSAILTAFPNTGLGNQLLQVAKLIQERSALGANKRQIFFASIGGFDTHDAQLTSHPNLMAQLDGALTAFNTEMIRQGVHDSVTSFTLSEFGRTVQNSGDGTDHAWGAHALLMGGAVQGGKFYGTYPSLQLGGPDDVDTGTSARGRILPRTAVDQYASTLSMWFGLDMTEVRTCLPNIDRFSTPNLRFFG